jgi:hypothetical protein
MRSVRLALMVLTGLIWSSGITRGTAALLNQNLTVGGITVMLDVEQMARNQYEISAAFKSSSYPVGCLSTYRDFHYELRDSSGRVIPVNEAALAQQQDEGQINLHITTKMVRQSPPPCEQNAPMGWWEGRALLSVLYPQIGARPVHPKD